NSEDKDFKYCTLTHCWGDGSDIPKLTVAQISEFQIPFNVASLPRTFQDAIHITKSLGISYLWIDSLCIIQDSADDWAREAARMGSIYENSACTIAAAAARNAHGGCFFARNPLNYVPCKIPYSKDPPVYSHSPARPSGQWHDIVMSSPLMARAWVVQELLLSPRMLFCGDQGMFWMCSQGIADERMPLIFPLTAMRRTKALGAHDSFSKYYA